MMTAQRYDSPWRDKRDDKKMALEAAERLSDEQTVEICLEEEWVCSQMG